MTDRAIRFAIAGALFVLATVLAWLDAASSMSVVDYVASGCVFAATGSLAIELAIRGQRRRRSPLASIGYALVAAAGWLAVLIVVDRTSQPIADQVALGVLLFLLVLAVLGVRFAQDRLAAEAAAQRAQLEALRHQLDPHFLFNALNTISALVRENPAAAEHAIANLSRLLRHSLATDDHAGTVAHEVEVCRAMAALARARFEDAIVFEEHYEPAVAGQPLPPFLVQPLVENAIAHGMRTAPSPVKIQLAFTREGSALVVEVANDGVLETHGDPASIGLTNLRTRLELLFPQRHAFTLEQRGARVHARLEIHAA